MILLRGEDLADSETQKKEKNEKSAMEGPKDRRVSLSRSLSPSRTHEANACSFKNHKPPFVNLAFFV